MKINIPKKLIDENYISVKKHPEYDLYIYNCTAKAQYNAEWNQHTLLCRGLILDGDKNIISRPFTKIFNYEELSPIDRRIVNNAKLEFTEKYDGSLGILYKTPDGYAIATRGSFTSKQAIKGTQILKEKYNNIKFNDKYTYLFEIIYPENKIVVDYGDFEDLILLNVINNKTGLPDKEQFLSCPKFKKAQSYNFNNLIEAYESEIPNKEGYVVYAPEYGIQFKVKFQEYKKLHRSLSGLDKKKIWEILSSNQSIDELLKSTPDEFHNWAIETSHKLKSDYSLLHHICVRQFMLMLSHKFQTDQEKAEYIKKNVKKERQPILFAMLQHKNYSDMIWKLLKPKENE